MHVREKPPLAVTFNVATPSGSTYRWAGDEPDAWNVPSGARWSDTMPGGFDTLDVTLQRDPNIDYHDLERLSTITVRGAGGAVVGEYRLERAPATSGDQMAVSPSAVGWQAALDDNKTAREIYVDRDLNGWTGDPPVGRVAGLGTAWVIDGNVVVSPDENGDPRLAQQLTDIASANPPNWLRENWYDASGIAVGSVYFTVSTYDRGSGDGKLASPWQVALVISDDVTHTGNDRTANLIAGTSGTLSATGPRYYGTVQLYYQGTATAHGDWQARWSNLRVYGAHGLPKRGAAPEGLYASDIVRDAVHRWAPVLRTTTDSVPDSAFIVSHAVYKDATTVHEIITDVSRYELLDWAVWDDRTFWMTQRGATGKAWRARIGPSELQETGPQVDRIWTGVIVEYKDSAGASKTVGPPGSGANTETTQLQDQDPENPANKLGITRVERLQMDVGDDQTAIGLGVRFLAETKLLNTAGQAKIVGYVEDASGVTWPYHAVRAGDTITFVDANDPSPRRIVRTDKDAATMTCTIDLDAPPEGLQAVLARLGMFMV